MLKFLATGNLGADPELKYTAQGKAVCNFRIGVGTGRRDPDGNPLTEWVRCVAWEEKAELCAESLRKGSKVLIEGRPTATAWKDRDGEPRAQLEVTVFTVEFLSPRPADAPRSQPGPGSREWHRGQSTTVPARASELDDLPF